MHIPNIKKIIAVALICVIGTAMTACDSKSSDGDSDSNGICQFDGCTRKATSIGGEFCDYHSKALNDYWDAQN